MTMDAAVTASARRTAWASVIVVLATGCVGPGSDRGERDSAPAGRAQVSFHAVEPDGVGRLLRLGADSCQGHPRARVTETASEVRVSVTADSAVGTTTQDCADGVAVRLSRPLDGRPVIDESTGEEVAVTVVIVD